MMSEIEISPGQMTLDEISRRPVARHTDPITSHIAAARAEPNAATNRALALEVLRRHSAGLTDFELAEITGLQQTSIGKRRGELRDAGFVRDSGMRRPAPSGSPAIVWEIVVEPGFDAE